MGRPQVSARRWCPARPWSRYSHRPPSTRSALSKHSPKCAPEPTICAPTSRRRACVAAADDNTCRAACRSRADGRRERARWMTLPMPCRRRPTAPRQVRVHLQAGRAVLGRAAAAWRTWAGSADRRDDLLRRGFVARRGIGFLAGDEAKVRPGMEPGRMDGRQVGNDSDNGMRSRMTFSARIEKGGIAPADEPR